MSPCFPADNAVREVEPRQPMLEAAACDVARWYAEHGCRAQAKLPLIRRKEPSMGFSPEVRHGNDRLAARHSSISGKDPRCARYRLHRRHEQTVMRSMNGILLLVRRSPNV